MKNRKTHSLFSSILIGQISAVLLSIILIGGVSSTFVFNYFYQNAVTRNQGIATSVANRSFTLLEDPINELQLIHHILQSDNLKYSRQSDINELLETVNQTEGYFENIEIIDVDGKVVNTFPKFAHLIGFDRSSEDYHEAIRSGNELYWSLPDISPSTSNLTVTLAIVSGQNLIVGSLDLSYISWLSHNYSKEFGSHIHISITDSRGVYLINENMNFVLQRRLDPSIKTIQSIFNKKAGNFQMMAGKPEISTVSIIPLTGWYVSVKENYLYAMQGVFLAYVFIAGFLLLTVILFILLSFWTTRRLVTDIGVFIKQTEKISNGNFEIVPEQKYYTEFERLAVHFRKMIENIRDRDQLLIDTAYHDRLTGFYNRAFLYEFISKRMIQEAELKFGLIYMDIDNFKNINDTFGNYLGDVLLVELGKEMNLTFAKDITIIRLGGDEFALIVPMSKDQTDVHETLDQLAEITSQPLKCEGRMVYFTISMGISIYPKDGTDIESLMRCADIALYDAKRLGKDDYVYFSPMMNQRVEQRLNYEQQLRPALARNEFFLEYQPQFSIDMKSIRGFEALIRWNSPVLGRVNPADFIAVAEESRLILKIDEWVLAQACETVRKINESFISDYVMSINVSPVELRDAGFAKRMIDIVAKSGIKPGWLEVEITENVSIDFLNDLIITIRTLRDFGISVSIDDFGTGYSSLSYLHRLPIDILKIDRAFIMSIEDSKENRLMSETILLLAHKLGLKTIAEGVETESQHLILTDLGCDFIQGYYASKPISIEELMEFLQRQRNPQFG